ncbi:MAG: hypothetical protein GY714_20305 [Desulfobacterales bacterium]|nr:hypothetical protein [Desulfobacterales bacterium]
MAKDNVMKKFNKSDNKGKSSNFIKDVIDGTTSTVQRLKKKYFPKKKKKKVEIELNSDGLLGAMSERKKNQQKMLDEISK